MKGKLKQILKNLFQPQTKRIFHFVLHDYHKTMKSVRFSKTQTQNTIKSQLTSQSIRQTHNKTSPRAKFHNLSIRTSNKFVKNQTFPKMIIFDKQFAELRKDLLKQYEHLKQLYETNEEKLARIIQKQFQINPNYLYTQQLTSFIRSPIIYQPETPFKHQLFKNDIINLKSFLIKFNLSKRIKQIENVQQSMINREIMIKQISNSQQYKNIYQSLTPPLRSTSWNIYDQYKGIKNEYNLRKQISEFGQVMYNKLTEAQQRIHQIMKKERKQKENVGLIICKDKIKNEKIYEIIY